MTVHFIGAGPGAPDLITVRGLRLIERCPVCLYAGSLVPREILAAAPAGARLIDTTPRVGAHNTRIAFVHPSSTHGVLLELVEHVK